MEFASLNDMFRWRAERSGPATALMNKDRGRWVDISWRRYYESVRFISQGLHALGLQKGERVAISAVTRVEWLYCDMAILGCGGVTVPIYYSSPTADFEYIVNHSDAKIVIVENSSHLDKLLEVREKLPQVEKIIMIEGPAPDEDDSIISLSDVVELGRKQPSGLYEKLAAAVTREDPATIVYTSTSRPNVGVLHCHSQLLDQQEMVHKSLPVREGEITVMFLPLSHIFGRVVEYMNTATGIQLAFADSYSQLADAMIEINPHMLAAVPRIYQKISASVLNEVEMQVKAAKVAVKWALTIGKEYNDYRRRGIAVPLVLATKHKVARKIFLDRLRQRFGSRVHHLISSGAPLSEEIGRTYYSAGMPVLEAYGMTELAGAVTMNTPSKYKIGSVGSPLPGVEIDLADDGEILVKSSTIMHEYWKDPEGTSDALKDGWLYTGDIGEIDVDGFLKITDRKKNLIITSGGKNISPRKVENVFRADPFIKGVYIHGDGRNFLSALILLEEESITKWAKEKGIAYKNFKELTTHPEVIRLIEERVAVRNRELAGPETIKKFKILAERFSVEGGELTSTMKLDRRFIDQKYQTIFDGFYE